MIEKPNSFEEDPCASVMRNIYSFLHGELPDSAVDEIRQHLIACEKCMDDFDAEEAIGVLVRRCWGSVTVPIELRVKISQLRLHASSGQEDN